MQNWEAIKQRAANVVHTTLGEPILYHYREGETQAMCGVFSMVDVLVSMGEVDVDSQRPMCSVLRCDVQRKPKQGDLITRRNVTYEVERIQEKLDASFHLMLHAVDERHAVAVRDKT